MRTKLIIVALFAITFVLSMACKQAEQGSQSETTDTKLNEEEIKAGIEEMVFPLPEPMGVYSMLEEIGAIYDGSILNPVSNLDNYHPSNVKATNLGVYAADLSYATVYNNDKTINSYSKALKSLIDDLEIKVDYKKLMSEETKDMVSNTDSLIKLTTDIFLETYEFLHQESDPALAVLMVNGFYIEGLYITTRILEGTYDNIEMVKIIYSQAKPLEEVIKLNEKYNSNQYVKALQGALIKLKGHYETTDGSLTMEQLNGITSLIEEIRNSLIS